MTEDNYSTEPGHLPDPTTSPCAHSNLLPAIEARPAPTPYPEIAELYHQVGYMPLPTSTTAKYPSVLWKAYQAQRPSINQVTKLFDARPVSNIGLITGGESQLLVVDIDPRNGGSRSLATLIDELGEDCFNAPTISTPSGGMHLYYRSPEGTVVPSRSGMRDGIDIKADRGFVMAPPSLGKNGVRYQWLNGPVSAFDLPLVPDLLLRLILESKQKCVPPTDQSRKTASLSRIDLPKLAAGSRDADGDEFRTLWSKVGIDLMSGENMYNCPFHDDRNPSLSSVSSA